MPNEPQDPTVSAALQRAGRGIAYEDWKTPIQTATDLDQLVAIVRAYLAQWRPAELRWLPVDLAATALSSSEDIAARAVLAAQAELKMHRDDPRWVLLREMTLTLTAAANRLRLLTTLRARESRL